MKITIDTEGKETVVRVQSPVDLGVLVGDLEKLFPDGSWRKFSLDLISTSEFPVETGGSGSVVVYNTWSSPTISEGDPYPVFFPGSPTCDVSF